MRPCGECVCPLPFTYAETARTWLLLKHTSRALLFLLVDIAFWVCIRGILFVYSQTATEGRRTETEQGHVPRMIIIAGANPTWPTLDSPPITKAWTAAATTTTTNTNQQSLPLLGPWERLDFRRPVTLPTRSIRLLARALLLLKAA
jgi:hypothetical protein